MGSCYVIQVGFELLNSRTPAPASRISQTTSAHYCTRLDLYFLIRKRLQITYNLLREKELQTTDYDTMKKVPDQIYE
jgi:hypothetical protein